MKRTLIEIIVALLLVSWGAVTTTTTTYQTKRVKELKEQVKFQNAVIDSLITLPRKTFEVKLNVSDNSKTTLNARKQSGEIIFPNTKTYELKIDSLTISLLNEVKKYHK